MPARAKSKSKRSAKKSSWWVYLVRCADASLYCGVTTDLKRRVIEHSSSKKSARYTRSRRPVELAWSEKQKSHGAALKREWDIKQKRRAEKERLVGVVGVRASA